MKAVANANAEGCYKVDVTPLADCQMQFLRLFCCPSRCNRTFRHFDDMDSVDRAHQRSVLQRQLFTMTIYYARRS